MFYKKILFQFMIQNVTFKSVCYFEQRYFVIVCETSNFWMKIVIYV